jgi:hypothetical protein
MDLRFRHHAVWREARDQDLRSCLENLWTITIGLLCLRDRFLDVRAPFVMPTYLKMVDGFEQKFHDKNVAPRFTIRGYGLKRETVSMTGVHVFAICVKTGIFNMRST